MFCDDQYYSGIPISRTLSFEAKSFLEQYNFTPAFSNQFSFPLEVRKIGIPLYVVSLILINSILENKLYSQQFLFFVFQFLRWLNRVMAQDHAARASDLNPKLILSFFLLFS